MYLSNTLLKPQWPLAIVGQYNFGDLARCSELVLCAYFMGACAPIFQRTLFDLNSLLLISVFSVFLNFRYRSLLCLSAYCLGLMWASYCFAQQLEQVYPTRLESVSVSVQGSVSSLPSRQRQDVKFEFRVTNANELNGARIDALTGKTILLSCYRCSLTILPDQQWRLTVRLKQPHGFASWGAFDYEKYLFRKQLIAKGYVRLKEDNMLLGQSKGLANSWRWRIGQDLNELQQRGSNADSSRGYAVMRALAIGDRSGLDKAQRMVFQDTGVSHLMAISGLHVGLVFIGVSFVFGWVLWPVAKVFEILPRQHLVLLPALAAAFTYSALAGFAISTQRALTMLCVYVLCKLMVRDVSLFKVLLISACLIVSVSPWSLLDVGFWLSCGAVFIIALVNQKSANNNHSLSLLRLQPKLWLGMAPMTVLFFGQISLVSPLVNLIAVPLFCMILIPTTLLAVLLQQVGLGDGLLVLLSHCFDWVYSALEWVASLPYAKFYSKQWFWLHWVLLLILLAGLVLQSSLRVKLTLGATLVLFVLFNPNNNIKDKSLELILLDVGQGLAMVVLKHDYVLVYDTGPRYGTGFSAAEAVVLPFLRSRGIRKIDMLIISHADNDHIGGYQTVMDAFDVGEVLTSRVDKLSHARECIAGQRWHVGESVFSIISPDHETPKGSNNRSCVLAIEHLGTRALITGDIEKQVERYLLRTQVQLLAADIMLVPHQGSKTSSTAAFIEAVKPQVGLLAAGYRNHYGHPHADVVARYIDRDVKLLSTVEDGSVVLTINEQGWRTVSYRNALKRFWHH